MKLKIKITKEVLEATKMCGIIQGQNISSNCAIAYAFKEIDSECTVYPPEMSGPIVVCFNSYGWEKIILPEIAEDFIKEFDCATPEERVKMQPFEFEVELTDKIINAINIEEAREALKQSTTLELIN